MPAGTTSGAPRTSLVNGISFPSFEMSSLPRGARAPVPVNRWRRWLPRVAGLGIVGGVYWLGWKDVTIAHQIHYRTVSRAVRDALKTRPLEADHEGRPMDSGFYCAWFQRFQGGKVLYTLGSIDGIPSSHYGGTFFVLATEPTTRWAMLPKKNYQPIRDRNIFLQSVTKGRTEPLDIGLPKLFAPILDPARYFRVYAGPEEPHPAVAGSIARLYALHALDSVLGQPLDDECATTVVIQTHDNAVVIGGAPHDRCEETDGIYRLYTDSKQPHAAQGHWDRIDRQPLWGGTFHRNCL